MADLPAVLSVFEAEHYVKDLRTFAVDEIASDQWMEQHDRLEKLNIQAHANAATKHDEYVVEALVSFNKMPVLVHELIAIELWREKVFPKIVTKVSHVAALKLYMVLHHEATLCNLLEVAMFSPNACAALDESSLDLVDYCYRGLNRLTKHAAADSDSDSDEEDEEDAAVQKKKQALGTEKDETTLLRQKGEIEFLVATCSVSLLRYMSENLNTLPIAVTPRLLDVHDVILSMVPILHKSPWTRRHHEGDEYKLQKFIDHKWVDISPADRMKITSIEGQAWLLVYNLIMDKECRNRYEYNSFRKETITQLKRHFNEILIDQLPMLKELQRWIEELNISDAPPPSKSSFVIIEQVSEIRSALETGIDYDELAQTLLKTAFADDAQSRAKAIEMLAKTYNMDNFESVLDDPICARPGCGKKATKRCSRCKSDWYCGRDCQVKHWKQHKQICDLLHNDTQTRAAEQQRANKENVLIEVL